MATPAPARARTNHCTHCACTPVCEHTERYGSACVHAHLQPSCCRGQRLLRRRCPRPCRRPPRSTRLRDRCNRARWTRSRNAQRCRCGAPCPQAARATFRRRHTSPNRGALPAAECWSNVTAVHSAENQSRRQQRRRCKPRHWGMNHGSVGKTELRTPQERRDDCLSRADLLRTPGHQ